ncbi:hypothetical protein Pla22_05920 [Rubripirellula amarantea]|uniref:SLA1 homology domain-containing protein n=1 Tax=Rubripirellula amarantea TaxID=2527999 RepID=A0A5C5WQ05_9BACT|nr:SHD1 domain-containing protein [Rubripirellula amarantea]TWT52964.1 hypothetical protein Pla22_05920 [Rubripirellula amarantea]
MRTTILLLILLLFSVTSLPAHARTWTSANGHYTLDADAIAFNDTTVILKKENGDLVAVEVDELSESDREFLSSKEFGDDLAKSIDEMQTWTSVDGLKVRGRVLAFGRRDIAVSRQRGKVHVGDKAFGDLDELHQKVVLKVMSKLEGQEFASEHDLTKWAKGLGAEPKVYPLEGVLMQLESGDEIGVPFFMFSSEDLKVLQPGWQAWLESEKDVAMQNRESLMMQAEAMEYQRGNRQRQQIELLKLNMMAIANGITSLWEVGLQPGQGVYGRPTTAVINARDSLAASQMAVTRYPGYTVSFVRRVSR